MRLRLCRRPLRQSPADAHRPKVTRLPHLPLATPYFTRKQVLPRAGGTRSVRTQRQGAAPLRGRGAGLHQPRNRTVVSEKLGNLIEMGVGAIKVDFGEGARWMPSMPTAVSGLYEHNLYRCATTKPWPTSSRSCTAKTSSGHALHGQAHNAIRCTGAVMPPPPKPVSREPSAAVSPSD